jgi:tRNA threonylcarbamoyl adenosine modification protein YjeE
LREIPPTPTLPRKGGGKTKKLSAREIPLSDLDGTRRLGQRIAKLLGPGDVVALRGPLGSGKSELARGLIRARAGAEIEVPSPSFTLIQDYAFPGLTIRHIDLFRIDRPAELAELGLDGPEDDEAWVIEWPERAGELLTRDRLDILLDQGPTDDSRIARLSAGPSWADRLSQLADARA